MGCWTRWIRPHEASPGSEPPGPGSGFRDRDPDTRDAPDHAVAIESPPGVSVELHQGHTASSLDGIRTRGGFS